MKKTLLCILSVLAIVFCFTGCQQNSDTTQAETTGSEIQQTTTAAEETEQTSEFSETSETEISEENTEAEAEPEGSEANVYVMHSDESKMWEYYSKYHSLAFSDNGITSEYVIIEHNGIIDEIPCRWVTRLGSPFSIYSGDYDGDGENELAAVRYSTGGTYCRIHELSIFKMIDWHYQLYTLDHMDIIEKYISYSIDNDNHTAEFTVNGLDTSFILDTSEYFDDEVTGVRYGSVADYFVDGDKITVSTYFFLSLQNGPPFSDLKLTMKVNFSDGEFICSEPVFEISEY